MVFPVSGSAMTPIRAPCARVHFWLGTDGSGSFGWPASAVQLAAFPIMVLGAGVRLSLQKSAYGVGRNASSLLQEASEKYRPWSSPSGFGATQDPDVLVYRAGNGMLAHASLVASHAASDVTSCVSASRSLTSREKTISEKCCSMKRCRAGESPTSTTGLRKFGL